LSAFFALVSAAFSFTFRVAARAVFFVSILSAVALFAAFQRVILIALTPNSLAAAETEVSSARFKISAFCSSVYVFRSAISFRSFFYFVTLSLSPLAIASPTASKKALTAIPASLLIRPLAAKALMCSPYIHVYPPLPWPDDAGILIQ
jgi:hypothetical protein